MTFDKPKGIGLITMCKYIDENIYTDNYDEYTVYVYLYHIIYDVARHKLKLTNSENYDMFAIEMATKVFMRYLNKKQYEDDENGNPKMEKIKSVLNYVNNTIGHKYCSFKLRNGSTILTKDKDVNNSTFNTLLMSNLDDINIKDFQLTTQNIGLTCEKFLESLPYNKNSNMWWNIYNSVLLTFLNNITPHIKDVQKIVSSRIAKDYQIDILFKNLKYQKPILFHLPKSMSNYIIVLTRQLTYLIREDLKQILNTKNICDYEAGCLYKWYDMESDLEV